MIKNYCEVHTAGTQPNKGLRRGWKINHLGSWFQLRWFSVSLSFGPRGFIFSLSFTRFLMSFSSRIPTAQTGREGERRWKCCERFIQFKDKLFYIHSSSLFNKALSSSRQASRSLLHPRSNFIFISALSFIPALFLSLWPGRRQKSKLHCSGLVHSYCVRPQRSPLVIKKHYNTLWRWPSTQHAV